MRLRLVRDDGAVVYLNGNEIYRTNLTDGAIDYLTYAGYAVGDAEESQFFTAVIDPSYLVNGTNVLAVEVHQANATSSDISFDLAFFGMVGGSPITSVYGQLYLDLNENYTRDADEDGIANISVTITDPQGSQTVVTNANGDWSAFVAPGSVTIDVDQSDPDFPVDATQTEGDNPTTLSVPEGENVFAGADGFYIQITDMVLIPSGSVRSYLDDGSDLGTAWKEPGFDDSGWATGPAEFGYGDDDEATVVSCGSDPKKKYVTTYFRHTFEVPDAAAVTKLNVQLLRDDGAIVYINGSQVVRSNMPVDPIIYKTYAASSVEGADESTFFTSTVAPNVLNTGTNVLAVELHQIFKMDEDISFDLQLVAQQSGNPVSYVTGALYYDADGNGSQDSGESGFANIDVIITDAEGAQTVSTNNEGIWSAMVAAGSVDITIDHTDRDYPSDATITEGSLSFSVAAVEGETTFAGADGFYISLGGTIDDFVWSDANHNGVQDEGENGVEGMTVSLFDSGDQHVSSATTDENGHYEFKALDLGDYHVQFGNLPAGAEFTLQNAGDETLDSDADASGVTASFTLAQDEIKTDIDAGIYVEAPPEPAQAHGFIWGDDNADGLFNRPEKYIGFVNVNLLSAGDLAVVSSTQADRKGVYSFTNIEPGDYIIQVINPSPSQYDFTLKDVNSDDTIDSDVNSDGRTDAFTLASGQIKQNIDAGLAPSGSVPQSDGDLTFVQVPTEYALIQNYSNPFNSEISLLISCTKDSEQPATIDIFNILGSRVYHADVELRAGDNRFRWQPTADVGTGLYIVKINADGFRQDSKIMYMK